MVRGWLAKALGASRGPQWVCDNCNHVHAAWAPVCENCGAFDTLDWKTPPHAEDAALAESAMLPLIVGVGAAAARPEAAGREPPHRSRAGRRRPAERRRRSTTPSSPAPPTRPGPPAAVYPLL